MLFRGPFFGDLFPGRNEKREKHGASYLRTHVELLGCYSAQSKTFGHSYVKLSKQTSYVKEFEQLHSAVAIASIYMYINVYYTLTLTRYDDLFMRDQSLAVTNFNHQDRKRAYHLFTPTPKHRKTIYCISMDGSKCSPYNVCLKYRRIEGSLKFRALIKKSRSIVRTQKRRVSSHSRRRMQETLDFKIH